MEILCRRVVQLPTSIMLSRGTRLIPFAAAAVVGVSYWKDCRFFQTYQRLNADEGGESWYSKLISSTSQQKDTLSDEHITQKLKRQEYSHTMKQVDSCVNWFETNHYNANNPIEDRHCECVFDIDNEYFFGIYDGHSGWHCSESLRLRLPVYTTLAMTSNETRQKFLSGELLPSDLVKYLGNPNDDCLSFKMPPTFKEKQEAIKSGTRYFSEKSNEVMENLTIEEALKYTYLSLDRDITRESIPDGLCNEAIWTGLSGAVAVSAYLKGRMLYVANTGDCRAVIGTKSTKGSWLPNVMSEDHNFDNIEEVKRLTRLHPGEKAVIFRGRLLGQLAPLRAFGDIPYKWSLELHRKVLDVLYGRPIVPESIYLTPPYLTAQPDITSRELNAKDGFLILATDGLWDTVSNEMAVKIVGDYLDDVENGKKPSENATTRLIKYALGGGSDYRLSEMMQIPDNQKRNFHDDITVTVVFFKNTTKSKL
ncbi:pyruvate dehydrogenase [acetyl-transferring]-phosphatase 2, mitochondrial-like [Clytia hemisphaerica]